MKKARHLLTGSAGEESAALYLLKQGHRILARNWRSQASPHLSGLELDIVSQYKKQLFFVEVRTRTLEPTDLLLQQDYLIAPESVLPLSKRKRLLAVAQLFLTEQDVWHMSCQFDLICVAHVGTHSYLEHHPHVFELSNPMDSSHTTWQPW